MIQSITMKITNPAIILSFLFVATGTVFAQDQANISYDTYAKTLKKYVDDRGMVNYEELKQNSKALDSFVQIVESADIESWSKNEQKAFWINAYNALTLNLIVEKYPLKLGGIRTINWGRPWSIKMNAAGREISLGEIEHEILRKWDPVDPRIHFAINCASIGCPRLPVKPFDPARLDQQLHYETKRFINDPEKVRLDREENILYYSAIFSWFEEDFLAVSDSILDYIKTYINEEDRAFLDANEVSLKVLKYDWGLNQQ